MGLSYPKWLGTYRDGLPVKPRTYTMATIVAEVASVSIFV